MPAPQLTQAVVPEVAVYKPTAQLLQFGLALAAWKVPVGHVKQSRRPSVEYVPRAQPAQLVVAPAE